eukprot:3030829-Pyramimonas_sp.AAC.1
MPTMRTQTSEGGPRAGWPSPWNARPLLELSWRIPRSHASPSEELLQNGPCSSAVPERRRPPAPASRGGRGRPSFAGHPVEAAVAPCRARKKRALYLRFAN